jgi:hypothetical protein
MRAWLVQAANRRDARAGSLPPVFCACAGRGPPPSRTNGAQVLKRRVAATVRVDGPGIGTILGRHGLATSARHALEPASIEVALNLVSTGNRPRPRPATQASSAASISVGGEHGADRHPFRVRIAIHGPDRDHRSSRSDAGKLGRRARRSRAAPGRPGSRRHAARLSYAIATSDESGRWAMRTATSDALLEQVRPRDRADELSCTPACRATKAFATGATCRRRTSPEP